MRDDELLLNERVREAVNAVLGQIRTEIIEEKDFAYADFDRYKYEVLGVEDIDDLPDDDFRYGMERAIDIIDKYR